MNKIFLYNIILIMFCFLFYSPRCESSANFIRIITSEKIDNMFNQISIDTMSTEQLIGLGIKKTPMIVLRNQNNETIGVHEGSAAFDWLNNLVQFRRQNMSKIVEQNRRKLIEANNASQNNKDIINGNSNELSGISDNYSYINIDYVPSKSFMPFGFDDNFKILTFNDNQGKINDRDMKSKMSEYNSLRQTTDNDIKTNVTQQLKNNLLNNIQNQSINM
jgi:hypothetical protein